MTNGEPSDTPQTPPGPRNTHFDFQSRVFQAPGALFELTGHPKKAMFAVEMGAGKGYISLKDLRSTFHIAEGSHDDVLIAKAEAGLHFVPDIRPGDEIPNEVLDGTASWTVARRHKQIARDRLQVQLLSWMSGKPITYASQDDLKKIMSDEANKKALRDAFKKAAAAMNIPVDESDKVLNRIEVLAREICYIEALRERAQELQTIRGFVQTLLRVYAGDQRALEDIKRIRTLMGQAIAEIEDLFTNVDAETADVLGAMMSIDVVISAVRKARDDIHFILMECDPVIAKWKGVELVRGQDVDRALTTTYQFLAKRYTTGKSLMQNRRPG